MTARVTNYSHLNFAGELEFTSFNDRLMDVAFWPKDVEGYVDALKAGQRLNLLPAPSGAPVAEIASNVELAVLHREGRPVGVRWSDLRLMREQHLWIQRFA